MGYPVTYRTEQARQDRRSRTGGSPSFQGANDNRPGTVRRLPSRSGMPRYNFLRMGQVRPPANPFGRAQRLRNQRAALGVLRGGFKIRSMLLRAFARFLLSTLFTSLYQRPAGFGDPNPYAPGWRLLSGRKGLYPQSSGWTRAHTNGEYVGHTQGPLTFNHPLAFPGSNWAEYDAVDILGGPSYWFTQVGQGDQGTGMSPAAWRAILQGHNSRLLPGRLANPWKPQYNPSWNRVPGRWPSHGFPKPDNLPAPPSIDPFSQPPLTETPAPFAPPYPLIPYLQPNPYRSPHEQSQRGPRPRVRVRPKTDPYIPPLWPPPEPKPPKDKKPKDKPDLEPDYRPKIITEFTPNARPRTRSDNTRDKKPGPGKKEIKAKAVRVAAEGILAIVNGISEFSDFLRALHKALPKKYQRRGKLVMDQWRDVYEHFDELDLPHALRSVARDQLEDLIYGKLGKISGKAAHKRGGLYDPAGRATRKLQDPDINGDNPDLIGAVLDRIFGSDT